MSDLVFTTVRTTRTASEAGLFINILEQAGLHPLELETANQSTFGGAEIFYSVKVPTEESTEAREILNAYASISAPITTPCPPLPCNRISFIFFCILLAGTFLLLDS